MTTVITAGQTCQMSEKEPLKKGFILFFLKKNNNNNLLRDEMHYADRLQRILSQLFNSLCSPACAVTNLELLFMKCIFSTAIINWIQAMDQLHSYTNEMVHR